MMGEATTSMTGPMDHLDYELSNDYLWSYNDFDDEGKEVDGVKEHSFYDTWSLLSPLFSPFYLLEFEFGRSIAGVPEY